MKVVVDSGLFIALLNPDDARHREADAFFSAAGRGSHGRVIAPEPVYVEVMNYLRRKPTKRSTCERMRDARRLPDTPIRWQDADGGVVAEAERLLFQHFDAGLSMTDAIVLATAKAEGASVATFDKGFRGLVPLAF